MALEVATQSGTSSATILTSDEPEIESPVTEKALPADIYSFGVSYAYKYNKLPLDLCGCVCLVFIVQVFGVISIVWSSSVRTSNDIVLKFNTYDIGLCYNSTGLYRNQECQAPIFDFNRYNDTYDTYDAFTVKLQEAGGQFDGIVGEADDPEVNWDFFAMGYVTVTVISLSILSIKVVNEAMCPLSMIMVSFHATEEWSNRNLLKYTMRFFGLLHLALVVFAWCVGYMNIAFYVPIYGLSAPADVILGPISLIFILEIDNWVIDIVRLRYAPTDYTFQVSKGFGERYNSVVFSFNVFFNVVISAFLVFMLYIRWNLFSNASDDAQKTITFIFVGGAAFLGGSVLSSIPFWGVKLANVLKKYSAIRM